MRQLFAIAVQIVCVVSLMAQTQGRIVFEEKMDMHRRIPPERAEMKEMIPQYRSNKFDLFFTQEASLYRAGEETQEETITGSQGGAQFQMRMVPPRREVYKNLTEDKMVDEREFMGKLFLIKGNTSPYAWKIADGQKKILDYTCMKATYQLDSATNYVAWFTPQLSISNGPAEFGGLPGMIVQVDINDGERTLTAMEVKEEAVDPALLKEPSKGKEVTQEEFREIMAEKMKEMQTMHGGMGPRVIIQHN